MLGLEEARGAHHIDGTGLEILRLTLLTKQADTLVMVNTNSVTMRLCLPEKIVKGVTASAESASLVKQRPHGAVNVFGQGQGRGALQENQQIGT